MSTDTKQMKKAPDPVNDKPIDPGMPDAPPIQENNRYQSVRAQIVAIADAKRPELLHSWIDVTAHGDLGRRGLVIVKSKDVGLSPNDDSPVKHRNSVLAASNRADFERDRKRNEERSLTNAENAILRDNDETKEKKRRINLRRLAKAKTQDDLVV